MSTIPHLIPDATPSVPPGSDVTYVSIDPSTLYDVALGGVGFMYANDEQNPNVRETAQYEKNRIDQGQTPGEQTLSNWWLKSQDSFHGGAGQTNLEPSIQSDTAHLRYDLSKNVDPFTPGVVRRLPDTVQISSLSVTQVVPVMGGGSKDDVAVLTAGGAVYLLEVNPTAMTATQTAFTAAASGVLSIASDGAQVYAATTASIIRLNPSSPAAAATTIASWPSAVSRATLQWVKSRLMAAGDNAIYEIDVSTTGVTLGATQLRLTHPQSAFVWRCFADSPGALIATGDAGLVSEFAQFTIATVSGAPVLQVSAITSPIPVGERVLSMTNAMGTFQAIGTTRGVRIGSFDSFYGRLTFGPLELTPNDPVIPGYQVFTRDRFVYAAGLAYDESGLMTVDLGTPVDQAGRFSWAPGLITPTSTSVTAASSGCLTPISSRIVFAVPGLGVYLEGGAPGTGREAWLRTSRIRYGTTEPKLFKIGSVRADLANAVVKVTGSTPEVTAPLATLAFTVSPPDFRLPSGRQEWLQLRFDMTGTATAFRSYAVKALPGTTRQLRIKLVLSIQDREILRSGQERYGRLTSRTRRDALETLSASGDMVLLQEFTPSGIISTPVVVEQVSSTQQARPTEDNDVGGTVTVILRTVDA